MMAAPPAFATVAGRVLVGGVALGAAMAGTLARGGGAVQVVRDADAVLDALEAAPFDLVLLDLDDPAVDAIATVQLYRFAALGVEQPPIVVVADQCRGHAGRACSDLGLQIWPRPAAPRRAMAVPAGPATPRANPSPWRRWVTAWQRHWQPAA